MNAESFKKLESQLVEAEEVFSSHPMLSRRAFEIRNDLRTVIGKVVAERIRTEDPERGTLEF
jgi:hypothetical protein